MIHINQVSKSFGTRTLFQDVAFTLGDNDKVGLVGRNGSGKSTLLKILAGIEEKDSGEINYPKGTTMGYLRQHLEYSESSLRLEARKWISDQTGAQDYLFEKILSGLGFSGSDFEKNPKDFSGGQQLRIELSRVLVGNPDVLFLDEPTNYLDIVGLRWLAKFLKTYKGAVVLITHDRGFMDSVVDSVVGISRGKVYQVKGNTQKFYQYLAEIERIHERTRANQEKKRAETEKFIERFRAKATKAKQVQSRIKQLEKEDWLEELDAEAILNLKFHFRESPGKFVINAEGLTFKYPEMEKNLFENLNFDIPRNARVGVIGKNGKGKSTLLNILASEFSPNEGTVSYHNSVQIGFFGQTNVKRLHPEMTVFQEVKSSNPELKESEIRGICGALMFPGEEADKKTSVLSGGEKARVLLGKIVSSETNVLILDEPTNHLDMESVEVLKKEISSYPGAVLIVSHNEGLLREVADHLIIFQGDKAEFFHGGYDDFLRRVGWDDEGDISRSGETKKLSNKEIKRLRAELIAERSKVTKPLKKKVEDTEAAIVSKEKQLEQLNKEMLKLAQKGGSESIGKIHIQIAGLHEEIDTLFSSLEEYSEKLEKIESDYQQKLDEI